MRRTPDSPVSRVVRIVPADKGLDYVACEQITTTVAEERAQDAATLQSPAFRDGDLVPWDSAVIVGKLIETHPCAPGWRRATASA